MTFTVKGRNRKDIVLGLNIVRLYVLIAALVGMGLDFYVFIYRFYAITHIILWTRVIIFIIVLLFILAIDGTISVRHLKDYKRFSGHYSIRPPKGYYDDFDFEFNENY
jgi:hypothetical protein